MCSFTLLLLLTTPPAGSLNAVAKAEVKANQLVRQLGSSKFEEREAAMRALRALGEQAIPALKRAAGSNDPEVRRRATQLLKPFAAKLRMREIDAIMKSQLTNREKGRRIKQLIPVGMPIDEVQQLIGNASCYDGAVLGVDTGFFGHYADYGLRIHFSIRPGDEQMKVDCVALEVSEPRTGGNERSATKPLTPHK
jgi:hypothetical protein